MFNSRDDALAFRDQLVEELDRIETDGWLISPGLEGATLHIGDGVGRVRGRLDGQGYCVTECDTDPDEGWRAKLEVRPA